MITANEKQRLMKQHRTDPVVAKATALKCTVCLAALALIAAIGAQSQNGDADATATMQSRVSPSVADSRNVMDERRARFEQRQEQLSGAVAAPLADNRADSREREPALDELMLLRRSSD